MAHVRTTVHHLMRQLRPRDWLKDTRDPEYAVGKLISPPLLPRREGS